MQQAAYRVIKHPRWMQGMALERQFGLPRGMLPSRAPDAETRVDRVLAPSPLEGATLGYLAHMLTITVQDWTRRKA